MKLVYLKKFNEAYSDELSFDMFKEILFDLSDDYECQFFDYSLDDSDPFYDCHLSIPYIDVEYPSEDTLSDNLCGFDEPEEVDNFDYIIEDIDDCIRKIEDVKIKMDSLIDRNKKIKDIMTIIQRDIKPRLESFSNCQNITFGYQSSSFRICFNLPSKD